MINIPDIGEIYALLLRIAGKSEKYSCEELVDLDRAVNRATSDLTHEISGLSVCATKLANAIDAANDEEAVEALIQLRIHVMDIATEFDNLTGGISLLFERRAIRKQR